MVARFNLTMKVACELHRGKGLLCVVNSDMSIKEKYTWYVYMCDCGLCVGLCGCFVCMYGVCCAVVVYFLYVTLYPGVWKTDTNFPTSKLNKK